MKFSTALYFVLGAVMTTANPIEKRELGGLLFCTGPKATGKCVHNTYKMEKCYNVPKGFNQNAATFAPDGEDFYCFPYDYKCGGICTSPEGCTLGHISYNSSVKFDLRPTGWDKYIQSFECHAGPAPSDGYCCD